MVDVDKLIAAVEVRPFLFDKRCPEYGNRTVLNVEWAKIGKEVGCNENDARRRWKKLRDYFIKSHKDFSSGTKRRKWHLQDRMQFLLPFVDDRKYLSSASAQEHVGPTSSDEGGDIVDNEDNLSGVSESCVTYFQVPDVSHKRAHTHTHSTNQPSYLDDGGGGGDETANTTSSTTTASNSHSHSYYSSSYPRHGKSKTKTFSIPQNRSQSQSQPHHQQLDAEEWLTFELAQRFAVGEKKIEVEFKEKLDDDEHFFKSLVPKMKLLSTVDKLECQLEIFNTVLKYVKKTTTDVNITNTNTTDQSAGNQPVHQQRHLPTLADAGEVIEMRIKEAPTS